MNTPPLITQIISLIGACLCLIAYIGHQLRWLQANKVTYNLLNILGSGLLAFIAFRPFQAGFVVMETLWAVISIYALLRILISK